MNATPLVTSESTMDLANRVTGAISTDAHHPANHGVRVLRWPSERDAAPMAIVELRHGPWSGSMTVLFHDVAPRVRVRVDLDPSCLHAMQGLDLDPFDHLPAEVADMNRWALLLHTVPGIIRRVAPTAATHSLDIPFPRPERDITATAAGHAA